MQLFPSLKLFLECFACQRTLRLRIRTSVDMKCRHDGTMKWCLLHVVTTWLIEGNGYETRQSSKLLYVIVLFFGLNAAQNTIVVYSVLRDYI